MKWIASLSLLVLVCGLNAFGQEKGVDSQNRSIRDTSNDRQPGDNGKNQSSGSGRGLDWGKGKTPPVVVLPNPYRLTGRKDVIGKAVEDLMRDRKMVLDSASSRPLEGVIISQPYTFIRGSVVAESEISRYASLPSTTSRGWTRGRYTLIVEIQPIDGTSSNVSVNARIEARSDGASGAEWTSLTSNGGLEQEFLNALVESVTGTSPNERPPAQP